MKDVKIYLVGGAVRDQLMGHTPKDFDYVVVGATYNLMIEYGFMKVGADFPVFLKDGQEYALARREKKTGTGYLGFESEFGTDVTLEDDLFRRDFSINSMAMSIDNGQLIDPFNGQEDMKNKVLRHTSDAFVEDPVRVLRMARFMARFGAHWSVAPETMKLIHKMAKDGVLSELQPDRVWKELSRALMEPHPDQFFQILLECDVLHILFPSVYQLKTALESRKWHPEGDAFEHTMLVLNQAVTNGYDLETRLACLVHDFGKGITPRNELPSHYGHDVNGVALVEKFCDDLNIPVKMKNRVMKTTRWHMQGHQLESKSSKGWIKMFNDLNVKQDASIVDLLYRVFVCDRRGRLGSSQDPIDDLDLLFKKLDKFMSVKFADVFPNGETNVDKIKQNMYKAQLQAVDNIA